MKNTYKRLLFVFALAIFSIGAMAQTEEVKKNSVREYKMDQTTASTTKYEWHIEQGEGSNWSDAVLGVDYEIWENTFTKGNITSIVDVDGLWHIYVKWLKEGTNYRVRVIEKDKDTKCFDPEVNEKTLPIIVKATDIDYTITPEDEACALAKNNVATYTVVISNNEQDKKWKFKYEVCESTDGGSNWTEWAEGTEHAVSAEGADKGFVVIEDGANNASYTLNLSIPDSEKYIGVGTYQYKVRIKEIRDFYNTPVNDDKLNKEATVIFNRIPKTGTLSTDN